MRHRNLSIHNGLGNSDPVLLDNKGVINKTFADAALDVYFSKEKGFDFTIKDDLVNIGIEPTYMYDSLKIISINRDKSKSYIQTGRAWGAYGSGITKTTKTYGEYKNKGKFIKFVDKWHEVLFGSEKIS